MYGCVGVPVWGARAFVDIGVWVLVFVFVRVHLVSRVCKCVQVQRHVQMFVLAGLCSMLPS